MFAVQRNVTDTETSKLKLKEKLTRAEELVCRLEMRWTTLQYLHSSIGVEVNRQTECIPELHRFELELDKKLNFISDSISSVVHKQRVLFNLVLKNAKQVIKSVVSVLRMKNASVCLFLSSSSKLEDLMVSCLMLLEDESESSLEQLLKALEPLKHDLILEKSMQPFKESLDAVFASVEKVLKVCSLSCDFPVHSLPLDISEISFSCEPGNDSDNLPFESTTIQEGIRSSIQRTKFSVIFKSVMSLTTFLLEPQDEAFTEFAVEVNKCCSELQEVMIEEDSFLDFLTVGSMCCAHVYNTWHRAKILAKDHDQVILLFIDRGSQEVVPFSSDILLPLPESLSKFPVMRIFCELYQGSNVYHYCLTDYFMEVIKRWFVRYLCGSVIQVDVHHTISNNQICAELLLPISIFLSDNSVSYFSRFSLSLIDILPRNVKYVNLLNFMCHLERIIFFRYKGKGPPLSFSFFLNPISNFPEHDSISHQDLLQVSYSNEVSIDQNYSLGSLDNSSLGNTYILEESIVNSDVSSLVNERKSFLHSTSISAGEVVADYSRDDLQVTSESQCKPSDLTPDSDSLSMAYQSLPLQDSVESSSYTAVLCIGSTAHIQMTSNLIVVEPSDDGELCEPIQATSSTLCRAVVQQRSNLVDADSLFMKFHSPTYISSYATVAQASIGNGTDTLPQAASSLYDNHSVAISYSHYAGIEQFKAALNAIFSFDSGILLTFIRNSDQCALSVLKVIHTLKSPIPSSVGHSSTCIDIPSFLLSRIKTSHLATSKKCLLSVIHPVYAHGSFVFSLMEGDSSMHTPRNLLLRDKCLTILEKTSRSSLNPVHTFNSSILSLLVGSSDYTEYIIGTFGCSSVEENSIIIQDSVHLCDYLDHSISIPLKHGFCTYLLQLLLSLHRSVKHFAVSCSGTSRINSIIANSSFKFAVPLSTEHQYYNKSCDWQSRRKKTCEMDSYDLGLLVSGTGVGNEQPALPNHCDFFSINSHSDLFSGAFGSCTGLIKQAVVVQAQVYENEGYHEHCDLCRLSSNTCDFETPEAPDKFSVCNKEHYMIISHYPEGTFGCCGIEEHTIIQDNGCEYFDHSISMPLKHGFCAYLLQSILSICQSVKHFTNASSCASQVNCIAARGSLKLAGSLLQKACEIESYDTDVLVSGTGVVNKRLALPNLHHPFLCSSGIDLLSGAFGCCTGFLKQAVIVQPQVYENESFHQRCDSCVLSSIASDFESPEVSGDCVSNKECSLDDQCVDYNDVRETHCIKSNTVCTPEAEFYQESKEAKVKDPLATLKSSSNENEDLKLIQELLCAESIIEPESEEELDYDYLPPPPGFDDDLEIVVEAVSAVCDDFVNESDDCAQTKEDVKYHYSFMEIEVDEDTQFELVVSHVESPSLFYAFPVNQVRSTLFDLESSLFQYYSQSSNCIPLTVHEVKVETPCCVWNTENGTDYMYRGLIMSPVTYEDGKLFCLVLCVDYGWTMTISLPYVFKLDIQFFSTPILVSAFCLSGVFPKADGTELGNTIKHSNVLISVKEIWDEKVCSYFAEMVHDKALFGVLSDRCCSDKLFPVHSVFLYDTNGDDDVLINNVLVEYGAASRHSLLGTGGKGPCENALENWNPMEMDYRSSIVEKKKRNASKQVFGGHEVVYRTPCTLSLPETSQWLLMIVVGVTATNHVLGIIVGSYSNAVIEPFEPYLDFLTLLKEMDAFYDGQCESYLLSSDPVPGETVCVYNASDSHWYRATVVTMVNETSVKVFYIDVGYEDVVSLEDLCSLCPQFCHVPAQAIDCYLSDTAIPLGMAMDMREKGKCFVSTVTTGKVLLVKAESRCNSLHVEVYQTRDQINSPQGNPESLNHFLVSKGYLVNCENDKHINIFDCSNSVIYTPG